MHRPVAVVLSTVCPVCSLRSHLPLEICGALTSLSAVLWRKWRQIRNYHLKPQLSFPPGDPVSLLASLPATLSRPPSSQISFGCMPSHLLFQKLCKTSYLKEGFVLVLPGGWGGGLIVGELTLPSWHTCISGTVAHHHVQRCLNQRGLVNLFSQVFGKERKLSCLV